jgi:uncharacterized paraquat-inducible protein A
MANLRSMAGGMVRCVECGEVQWNLLSTLSGARAECRVCGAELRPERRRPGRRFTKAVSRERRDTKR